MVCDALFNLLTKKKLVKYRSNLNGRELLQFCLDNIIYQFCIIPLLNIATYEEFID